jgi:hypothetical protein
VARKQIDWEAIEREYRAGQLSVVEIGRQNGVSHTAINKRAKAEKWKRDLAKRVRQEVSARLVSPEVSEANARQAVDDAAARVVEVVREHRKDIKAGRHLVSRMMSELDATTSQQDALEAEILAVTGEDSSDRRRNAMMKAIGLPARAGVIRDLSNAMKNLVGLERQAFSMDADPNDDEGKRKTVSDDELDSRIAELLGKA